MAMRQEEICGIAWADVDASNRTVIVRDRKDPRHKTGNDQKVPLLDVTGYDAMAMLEAQKAACSSRGRIFPYNARLRRDRIPADLSSARDCRPSLPRPTARGHLPPVRGRPRHSKGGPGDGSQGLEDGCAGTRTSAPATCTADCRPVSRPRQTRGPPRAAGVQRSDGAGRVRTRRLAG